MSSHRYFTAPDYVAACDFGSAVVLVNYRTGQVHTLLGDSARWWSSFADVGDTNAVGVLGPPDATVLLDQLCAAGLLVVTTRPRPWTSPHTAQPWRLVFGTCEAPAAHTPTDRPAGRLVIVAGLALAVTLVVKHVGATQTRLWRLTRLLCWSSRLTRHPASPGEAQRAVHAVRRAGVVYLGRAACLEESVAVVLTMAALRRGVTWCHGVAADPIRLHSWIESTEAGPVAEPPSTRQYTILRTIPRIQGDGQ